MADISRLINEYTQMFYDRPEPFSTEDLHQIERLSNRTAGGVTLALAAGYMQGWHDSLNYTVSLLKRRPSSGPDANMTLGEIIEELDSDPEIKNLFTDLLEIPEGERQAIIYLLTRTFEEPGRSQERLA